jgi:putative ABC transport system substrate-binding protein
MRRRDFITFFGGTAAAWSLAARAQQPAKMKRIAYINSAGNVSRISVSGRPQYRAFFEELSRLGYVEGQNLGVERYSGEGRTERYAELARDVVNTSRLDFSGGRSSIVGLQNGDEDNPDCDDNHRSDCNGTCGRHRAAGRQHHRRYDLWGIGNHWQTYGAAGRGDAKTVPVGYLASRPFWEDPRGAAVREAAKQAGISLSPVMLSAFDEAEYQRVFRSMEQDRADAFMVSDEPENSINSETIVELAAKSRIPAIYPVRDYVEAGGLMAYSPDLVDIFRRVANLIDKILRGANPGDIPFYQPTKFELSVNLRTAKALGLKMPAMLLGRADEVIE